jgi:hypothetical protein
MSSIAETVSPIRVPTWASERCLGETTLGGLHAALGWMIAAVEVRFEVAAPPFLLAVCR